MDFSFFFLLKILFWFSSDPPLSPNNPTTELQFKSQLETDLSSSFRAIAIKSLSNDNKRVVAIYFLTLSFLLVASTASAIPEKDCTAVDLRDPGKSMQGSPQFNQSSRDYCWAFAGTQLASSVVQKRNQKNFQYPAGQMILSPTVTMNHAIAEDIKCLTPCEIVNKVFKSKKGCSYQDVTVQSQETQFHPDTGLNVYSDHICDRGRSANVDQIEDDIKDILANAGSYPEAAIKLIAQNPKANMAQRQKKLLYFMSKRTSQKSLIMADLYNATVAPTCMDLEKENAPFVGSRNLNQVLSTFKENQISCQSYRTQKFENSIRLEMGKECPKLRNDKIQTEADLMKKINEMMSSNLNYPVAIDYCYAFLYDGEVTEGPQICNKKNGQLTTDHKSLVIGRRFNKDKNTCEFLLRDTRGKDNCSNLHPKWKPSCEEEFRKNKTADTWIPVGILEKAVHGLSIIKEN